MPIRFPWDSTLRVLGYADNFPIRNNIGNPLVAHRENNDARRLEMARIALRHGRTSPVWALRFSLSDLNWHAEIPETLRPDRMLRVGDQVEAIIRPVRPEKTPVEKTPNYVVVSDLERRRGWVTVPRTLNPLEECVFEYHFKLGVVTEIVSVCGNKPTPLEERPPLWPNEGGIYPQHLVRMEGMLPRFLRLTNTMFGEGDRVVIKGPPDCGKTMFMMEVLKSIKRGIYRIIVLALGEHEGDIAEYRRIAAQRGDTLVVGVPSQSSPLPRLRGMELGILAGLRGEESDPSKPVIFLIDSLSGGLVDAVNSLGAPEGVGIKAAGLNPSVLDAIPAIYGFARALKDGRSVTIICSLVLREPGDFIVANKVHSVTSCAITLSPEARREQVFPGVDFGMETTRVGGRDQLLPLSISRYMTRMAPEYTRLAPALNIALGEWGKTHAGKTNADGLRQLLQEMGSSPDDGHVVRRMLEPPNGKGGKT